MNALDCSSDLQPQPREKKVRKNQKKSKEQNEQKTIWTHTEYWRAEDRLQAL